MYLFSQNKMILTEAGDIEIRKKQVKVGENSRMFSGPEPVMETRYLLVAFGRKTMTDEDGLFGPSDMVLGQFTTLERAKSELTAIVNGIRNNDPVYEIGPDYGAKMT